MPPFPRALGYLWTTYLRLRRRIAPGFSGPAPVGWQDIDAFIHRAGIRLAPWEIELLEALDDIYLRPEEAPQPVAPEGQPLRNIASIHDGIGIKAMMASMQRRAEKRGKHG